MTTPTLSELLEKARHHVMTDEEKEAQRQSWVRGEMALSESERGMTSAFPPMDSDESWEASAALLRARNGKEEQRRNAADTLTGTEVGPPL